MHIEPYLFFNGRCEEAIEFYKRALGAQEVSRMPAPDGKGIWHAELRIGDSMVFMNDEMPGTPVHAPATDHLSPANLWVYVNDCDAAYQKALQAGAITPDALAALARLRARLRLRLPLRPSRRSRRVRRRTATPRFVRPAWTSYVRGTTR